MDISGIKSQYPLSIKDMADRTGYAQSYLRSFLSYDLEKQGLAINMGRWWFSQCAVDFLAKKSHLKKNQGKSAD